MKLSIGMIVKNEEKYLDECLTALKPILEQVDSELIIVDTGSTDKTVEIAKKHTEKVYYFEWIGDFAAARNESLKYSKGEWFLFVDADEILEDASEIIKFFNSGKYKDYNSAMLQINNITNKNENRNSKIFINRFNKVNDDTKFEGMVHESISFLQPNIILRNTTLNHYGYSFSTKDEQNKKGERNIKLLLAELEKRPDNILLRTQLTDTYFILNDINNALIHAKKAVALCENNDTIFRFTARLNLIKCHYVSNNFPLTISECENYLNESNTIYLSHIDVYFMLSIAYLSMKNYDSATATYEKYANLYELYNKNQLSAEDEIAVSLSYASPSHYITLSMKIIDAYIDNNNVARAKKLLSSKELLNYDNKINIKGRFYLEFKIMKINKNYDAIKRIYSTIYSCENAEPILNEFEECIEAFIIDNDDEICLDVLSVLNSLSYERDFINYSKLRLQIKNDDKIVPEELYKFIDSTAKLDVKYADLLYYIVKSSSTLSKIVPKVPIEIVSYYTNYCLNTYKDFKSLILNYKTIHSYDTIILSKILDILMQKLNENSVEYYKEIIDSYFNSTSYLIKTLYPNLESSTDLVKYYPADIRFIYYFNLAYANKGSDKKSYIKNLRQALKENEAMKGVVELLFKEITDNEKEYNENKNEFEELAIAVKKQIKMFIKNNDINTAKALLEQYKQINPSDEDIANLDDKINS